MKQIFAILLCFVALTSRAQSEIEEWLQNGRPEHIDQVIVDENGRRLAPRKVGSQKDAPIKAVGVKKVPVILVAFADQGFTCGDSTVAGANEYYDKFCNGTRDGKLYTGHGSHGSIRDYFVEMSDSAFLPEFAVIGPVTLDNGYATYGKNSSEYNKDAGFSQFRIESIQKAQAIYDGNWSDFDNDGNGSVDMIFFVFAGVGENTVSRDDPDRLWPKESTASITINGTAYACSAATCEARPSKTDANGKVLETKTDGVGVFIHEFSHALGLPDFYDLMNVAFGMDIWSVMDYGEYGNNGYNPGNYTAYERDFMGWQPLEVLDGPQILNIPCFADGGKGYKIVNEANPNEYYVLENRQAKGWDDRIGRIAHGLQVTHVDYDASKWNSNYVNVDPYHQRMTIISASNNYNGTNAANSAQEWAECLQGNLFPGSSYNYNLTDDSDPAAKVYTGGLMHRPIRNITENEDGTITLCYMTNGQLDTPVLNEPENVDIHSMSISWGEVENATRYVLEVEVEDMGVVVCDTLTECSRECTDLRENSPVRYRVKAMADMPEDYLDSEWSDYVETRTLVDLIESVDASLKKVAVYDLDGRQVAHCWADEVSGLPIRRGIYVLKYNNGATRKVVLK